MLAAHQMELPERAAQQVISDHLDTTARLMRTGRQAARRYVTDEVIAKLVDRLLGVDMDNTDANVVSLADRPTHGRPPLTLLYPQSQKGLTRRPGDRHRPPPRRCTGLERAAAARWRRAHYPHHF